MHFEIPCVCFYAKLKTVDPPSFGQSVLGGIEAVCSNQQLNLMCLSISAKDHSADLRSHNFEKWQPTFPLSAKEAFAIGVLIPTEKDAARK